MKPLRRRESQTTGGFESSVIAHGPQAESLANQYVDLLRRWARDYRRRGAALFRYLPTPASAPLGTVPKRHGIVTVTWH